MGVAFDELFDAVARKADGEAAVVAVVFDPDDGADAVSGMANTRAEERVYSAACSGARGRRADGKLFATAKLRFVEFGIRFVAARFAGFTKGTARGLDKFAGNFRQKTRRRSCGKVGVGPGATIDGAREREGLFRASHADVAEAALLFDGVVVAEGAVVRKKALFETGEKNVIEFEALGAVKSHERDGNRFVEGIGIADESGAVEDFFESLAIADGFGDGGGKFAKIFGAGGLVETVLLLGPVEIAGAIENEFENVAGVLMAAFRSEGGNQPAKFEERRRAADFFGRHARDGLPERLAVFAGGVAERCNGDLADAARRNVQDAEESDVVIGLREQANVGEGVFHFGALVETEAADHAVTNGEAAKRFFEGA